jgi:hypothetical protein
MCTACVLGELRLLPTFLNLSCYLFIFPSVVILILNLAPCLAYKFLGLIPALQKIKTGSEA